MEKNLPWIVLGVIAYFAYRKWSESQPVAQAQALLPEGGQSIAPTIKTEWAGSDLYKTYGTVLPSGKDRDLIR